jgi:dTMP kinase
VGWLASWLSERGRRVVTAREPGGTPIGEQIRSMLLHPLAPVSAPAALLLFNAARAELVRGVLRPALEAGQIVVCDRFTDSTLAYQGFGEGVPLDLVRAANGLGSLGLVPDLTILLDVPVEVGLRRRRGDGEWNTLDDRPLAFHRAVREGFLTLAAAEPHRWLVVDAARPVEEVRAAIASRVRCLAGAGMPGAADRDGGRT